ncbi:MAG: DUF6580 family putative transport protein [Candidatus Uhrbacteria bacterium]
MAQLLSKRSKIIVAIILIGLSVAFRLVPHIANFAPVAAAAFFAAIYLGRWWAVTVPLFSLLIADWFIGFYSWPIMLTVYGAFILIGLGNSLFKQKDLVAIFIRSIFGSLFFFLVTNWAVWQFGFWYQHNLFGLMQAYFMAVPFFRNTLLGDLTFGLAFVGAAELFGLLCRFKKEKTLVSESLIG